MRIAKRRKRSAPMQAEGARLVSAPTGRPAEAQVLQRIAAARGVFCCLDYDGTLAPLAATPDAARPLPGTAALITHLAATPHVHVALVTGRPIADLRRFIDVGGAYYVGVHGAEVRLPNGEVATNPAVDAVRAVLPAMKRQAARALRARRGVLLEDKGVALACHYRLASAADAAAARATMAALVRDYQKRGTAIMLTYGHEVAEIRPTLVDKGRAACALIAAHAPAALPLYIGDDRTDEDAFARLPARSVTIRVSAVGTPTRARYRLAGPDDVHRFLRAILQARRQPRAKARR